MRKEVVVYGWFWISGLLLGGCGNAPLHIEGFDAQAWAADTLGCKQSRTEAVASLLAGKEMLLGQGQEEIKQFLGPPDKLELYQRSQRFFIYYVTPGQGCPQHQTGQPVAQVTLRFNALGRVHEVFYTN